MGTFTQLGKQFEAAHPGDTVKFSFGPSSGLATEITSGAPADVFALGVVYVTDVKAAGAKVSGVVIPASDNASTLYPIDIINSSTDKSVAEAFVAYVMSPAGQQVLTAAGFQKP